MSLPVVALVEDIRAVLDAWRRQGRRVAVVPTMGALHAGHQALVRRARELGDEVVVTIFVNPTQFGPSEDFEKYPRNLEADRRLAEEAGATLVFAPEAREIYPPGDQTRVSVGALAEGLCGASRPGHFTGVATVVSKFFALLSPATFVFGQKDYQQLKVLERVAKDMLFPVTIEGHSIVREADGLAQSSRNVYLSPRERTAALGISKALASAQAAFVAGERAPEILVALALRVLGSHELSVEYVELRDADTLGIAVPNGKWVLLVAARSGSTRLIDNTILGHDPALGGR
jgi:pantoate--beta-alanine ligase